MTTHAVALHHRQNVCFKCVGRRSLRTPLSCIQRVGRASVREVVVASICCRRRSTVRSICNGRIRSPWRVVGSWLHLGFAAAGCHGQQNNQGENGCVPVDGAAVLASTHTSLMHERLSPAIHADFRRSDEPPRTSATPVVGPATPTWFHLISSSPGERGTTRTACAMSGSDRANPRPARGSPREALLCFVGMVATAENRARSPVSPSKG